MFGLGVTELLVILVIVLVIFGAGKLPEIGSGLGRGIRGFRKEVGKPDEIDITPDEQSDDQSSADQQAEGEGGAGSAQDTDKS